MSARRRQLLSPRELRNAWPLCRLSDERLALICSAFRTVTVRAGRVGRVGRVGRAGRAGSTGPVGCADRV